MIKFLLWNIRGIGNLASLRRLQKLCKLHFFYLFWFYLSLLSIMIRSWMSKINLAFRIRLHPTLIKFGYFGKVIFLSRRAPKLTNLYIWRPLIQIFHMRFILRPYMLSVHNKTSGLSGRIYCCFKLLWTPARGLLVQISMWLLLLMNVQVLYLQIFMQFKSLLIFWVKWICENCQLWAAHLLGQDFGVGVVLGTSWTKFSLTLIGCIRSRIVQWCF